MRAPAWWLTVGLFAAAVVLAAGVLLLAGCPRRVCSPGVGQCTADGVARLCSSAGQWREVLDCRKVLPADRGWRCSCYKPTSTLESINPERCTCKPTR